MEKRGDDDDDDDNDNDSKTIFPPEIWISILKFVTIKELPNLFTTGKEIHQLLVNHEGLYKMFASLLYPSDTLHASNYGNSYKKLLQDGNAKNGLYILNTLHLDTISEWKFNRRIESMHYVNAVRSMIWDCKQGTISLEIEAFGNTDLRAAQTTSIFEVSDLTLQRLSPIKVTLSAEYNTNMYQLCILEFDQADFSENCEYYYTYNGSPNLIGTDYPCVRFLVFRNYGSLKELFGKRSKNNNDIRSSRGNSTCKFVSRHDYKAKPTDITKWPVELPKNVLEKYDKNQWGMWNGKRINNKRRAPDS